MAEEQRHSQELLGENLEERTPAQPHGQVRELESQRWLVV